MPVVRKRDSACAALFCMPSLCTFSKSVSDSRNRYPTSFPVLSVTIDIHRSASLSIQVVNYIPFEIQYLHYEGTHDGEALPILFLNASFPLHCLTIVTSTL